MSDSQVINNCKQSILEQVAKHEGDILKSDLYKLVESEGEATDIAMAIKSLRDEGRIVVFGDGKTARIMSGADSDPVIKPIINQSAVEQVAKDLIQVIEETKNLPEGSRVMSPEFGEKIESKIDINLPKDTPSASELSKFHDSVVEPVLPKQVPGNLSMKGTIANAAYCLFTAKTDNKFDALTLDIISARIKFNGLRGSLNNAVDYLVKLGYVTKHRDGPKPIFYWSGKFSRPFSRADVIPEPLTAGTRSPFLPQKEVVHPTNEEVFEVLKKEIGIENRVIEVVAPDAEPAKILSNATEGVYPDLTVTKKSELESPGVSIYEKHENVSRPCLDEQDQLDIKIDETVNSINVLSKYLDSLLERRNRY